MKKLIYILLIGLLSCSADPEPKPKTGCHTGTIKATGQTVFLECVTHEDYLKGEIRFPAWPNYSNHKWELCNDCK